MSQENIKTINPTSTTRHVVIEEDVEQHITEEQAMKLLGADLIVVCEQQTDETVYSVTESAHSGDVDVLLASLDGDLRWREL